MPATENTAATPYTIAARRFLARSIEQRHPVAITAGGRDYTGWVLTTSTRTAELQDRETGDISEIAYATITEMTETEA